MYNVILSEGVHYRLSVLSGGDETPIWTLYDNNEILGSTLDFVSGINVNSFDFECEKTAVYKICGYFKEGTGCCVGILSYIKKPEENEKED